jgi:hypothetical protein
MDYNSYIASEKFPQGTVFKYYDIAEAIVTNDENCVTQTKRGILSGDECLRKFNSPMDWIKTLPLHTPEEDYKINIEIPSSANKIVPPTAPMYVESLCRAYTLIKMINDKNNVTFKVKRSPSYRMLHSQAKISRMELDSSVEWQLVKLNDPNTWQNEYNKLTNKIIDAYENVQMALDPELMIYQVHNPKYPRVFVKNGDTMMPIYHISDGKGLIFMNGKVGPTWASLGLNAFPEIWVSYMGSLVKQPIYYYLGSSSNIYYNQFTHTQMELAILYREIPNEEGCLSNGKQVMNLKTRNFIEPWQVV